MKRGSKPKGYKLTLKTVKWYLDNPDIYELPSIGEIAPYHLKEWYLHIAISMYGKDMKLNQKKSKVVHDRYNDFIIAGTGLKVNYYVDENGKVGV